MRSPTLFRKRRMTQGALALAMLTLSAWAQAASTCSVGVGNLSFGTYTGSQVTSSTTMTITCTHVSGGADKIDFTATLSTGAGSFTQRILTNIAVPTDTLPYNLYLGAVPAILNTSVWGDGSGATVKASGTLLVNPGQPIKSASFTVAGAMAAVATLPTVGVYQDLIASTVTYN